MSNPIRAALDAAARRLCICDGECFATRHGMMHGPCEQDLPRAAAAVAAFHYKRADDLNAMGREYWPQAAVHVDIAAAVEAAGRE